MGSSKKLSDDEKRKRRELHRHSLIKRVRRKMTSRPKVHVNFCEQYFRCLQCLESGGDGQQGVKNRISVRWLERHYPRLAGVLEKWIDSRTENRKDSEAVGPRHMTHDEIHGKNEPRITKTVKITRSPDASTLLADCDDDVIKTYENEQDGCYA